MLASPTMRTEQSATSPSFEQSRQSYIETAKASPKLAGLHDKQAWLDLYAEGAIVEDPVGSRPSIKGRPVGSKGEELGQFYEAFIAPSDIRIESHRDIVAGHQVFRSVSIHTKNMKTGLQMQVPANLVYDIVDRSGELKVSRMRAYWEINKMGRRVTAEGARGYATMAVMNWSMLRAFGARWLGDYFKATQQGIRKQGKAAALDFFDALDTVATVSVPGEGSIDATTALARGLRIAPNELLASGFTVSGLGEIEIDGQTRNGAVVFSFGAKTKKIETVELFLDQ